MTTICFLNPVGNIGGAERVLLATLSEIQKSRPAWKVSVILCEDGPLFRAVHSLGIPAEVCKLPNAVSHFGDNKPNQKTAKGSVYRQIVAVVRASAGMLGFLRRLRKCIDRFNPDMVYSNGLKTHLISAVVKRRRYRLGWHAHDFYSHRSLAAKLLSVAASRTDVVVAISNAVQYDLHRLSTVLNVRTIYNGVDANHFCPGSSVPSRLDDLAGMTPPNDKVLRCGLVATYARWKGQDVFIRALQQVPSVRGYIIGGPIYLTSGSQWSRGELQQLAADCGVADRVGFIDFQDDTAQVYRDLDVVVHASIQPEPFGLTIVESMACGRPTVVASAGGAAELFSDGINAIGHIPGNIVSLAEAIQQLSGDLELRRQIAQAARQTALNRYSIERFGEELISTLEDTLGA